ncbi:MAG TPA: permease-like cell division protein FtsX [Candidatus Deferrimicrobiaceae bacterium]
MSRPALLWIDWRLAPGATLRDTILRFLFVAPAAFAFLVLFLSGGADRFLASRYAITAVLRTPVPQGEGEGLAGKVAALPPVRDAVYRDPDAAWKEFLLAYPGLDSLRSPGGNPLPGYIHIRMRPERLTRADVEQVTAALRSVPIVEKVLAGEERLPRMFLAKRYATAIGWGVFGGFAAIFLVVLFLQERGRAAFLADDFHFLRERGVPEARMNVSRAAGGAISASLTAAAGLILSGAALRFLLQRYPPLEQFVAPPGDLLLPGTVRAAAAFVLSFAVLAGGSSLLGSRAARARRK